MSDVNCPYCDGECEINHDDGYGYEEDALHNQECQHCGKSFSFTTSILFLYEAQKADCLNDAEHQFVPSKTYPLRYTKMVCHGCGETRKCTDDEMREILSGADQ